MKLLLHAGPMKTVTTAFQELMHSNSDLLGAKGLRFRWLRRRELNCLSDVMAQEQAKGWPKGLILSHECLFSLSHHRLNDALSGYPGERYAVMVARRLREVYPSFYLQNLKGHVMRSSSFKVFLKEQISRDSSPRLAEMGHIFRYQYLEKQLLAAGCRVAWLVYNRASLLKELVNQFAYLLGVPLDFDAMASLAPPSGTSPRRSLDGSMIPITRQSNRQTKKGAVSVAARDALLASMLDGSDRIRKQRNGSDPWLSTHAFDLDAWDEQINGDFWRRLTRSEP